MRLDLVMSPIKPLVRKLRSSQRDPIVATIVVVTAVALACFSLQVVYWVVVGPQSSHPVAYLLAMAAISITASLAILLSHKRPNLSVQIVGWVGLASGAVMLLMDADNRSDSIPLMTYVVVGAGSFAMNFCVGALAAAPFSIACVILVVILGVLHHSMSEAMVAIILVGLFSLIGLNDHYTRKDLSRVFEGIGIVTSAKHTRQDQ